MSLWEVNNRGLLPSQDPLTSIVSKEEKYIPLVARLENISHVLPHWINDRKVREELVYSLRTVSDLLDYNFLTNQSDAILERLMLMFSFMANAYVFADKESEAERLPTDISIPLTILAEKLGRKPILSYTSYFLYNWEKIDNDEIIKYDNIHPLNGFTFDQIDYETIKLMVDLEASGQEGITACCDIISNEYYPRIDDTRQKHTQTYVQMNDVLTKIFVSLAKMNVSIKRFNECTENYLNNKKLHSRYFKSFENIKYEGKYEDQLKIVPIDESLLPYSLYAILMALEICPDSHKKIEYENLPSAHQDFFKNLHSKTAKNHTESIGLRFLACADSSLREIYNECIGEIYQLAEKNLFPKSFGLSSSKELLTQYVI